MASRVDQREDKNIGIRFHDSYFRRDFNTLYPITDVRFNVFYAALLVSPSRAKYSL